MRQTLHAVRNSSALGEHLLALPAWAAAIACLASSLATIVAFHLRWPAFDLYRQYTTLLGLSFPANVFALENGHRPLLPNVVKILDVAWFGPGQVLSTWVAIALGLLTLVLLLAATARDTTLGPACRAALALGASMAVFWLGNARMLVQASEMLNVQFTAAALLLGAWCVERAGDAPSPARWGAAAGGCATIATFSFGPGIVAFPALIFAAIASRMPWRGLLALAAVFVVVLVVYVFALPGADGVRNSLAFDASTNLLEASQWLASPGFNAWFGIGDGLYESWRSEAVARVPGAGLHSPTAAALRSVVPAHDGWFSLSALLGIAIVASGTLLALRVAWRGRNATPVELTGLVLFAFGVGAGLLIAIARHELFVVAPMQVYADRYLPWSCLCWLGVFAMAVSVLPRRAAPVAIVVALLAAFVAWPVHIANAAWSRSVHLATEQGALAMRLGVWDDERMPNPADSPRDAVLAAAKLLREQVPGFYGRALGTERLAIVDEAAAPAVGWRVLRRFDDTLTGRNVVAFEGRLVDRALREAALYVLDGDGREIGVADTLPLRFQWVDAKFEREDGVRFIGYAFVPGDCRQLVLGRGALGGGAERLGTLAPCAP